ncbi:hypothetical protein EMIT0194P_140090 [Pseudomonas serbica]
MEVFFYAKGWISILSVSGKACGIHEHPHQAGHDEQRTDAASPDQGQPADPLPQRFFLSFFNVVQGVFAGHDTSSNQGWMAPVMTPSSQRRP